MNDIISSTLIAQYKNFEIHQLTKDSAETYTQDILDALDLIPLVGKHSKDDIFIEKTGDRTLHARWEHSMIALTHEKKFAGIILGYEREKEENEQYPENCIYIVGFAVAKEYQKQGLGKFLLETWIDYNTKLGFTELSGNIRLCVQTNKDDWNKQVQNLYDSVGFKKISEKSYGDRTDNVYLLNPSL